MSLPWAIGSMFVVAAVYAAVIFLSRAHNKGGRDPIDPLYSVSQWDPLRVELTGSCVVPSFPGTCIIEGTTGAYQAATHWCDLATGPCIDPDTGENVKNNPIDMQVVCDQVPYCGWSKCAISFTSQDISYVRVDLIKGAIVLSNDPVLTDATVFYMQRLSIGDTGLVRNQNGTIARFYFQLGTAADLYLLCYSNNVTPIGTTDSITGLTAQLAASVGSSFLTMFVLMEAMPTTVSTFSGSSSGIVARKILVFGGANRTSDPTTTELAAFNDHVQQKMWNNATTYDLTMIRWNVDYVTQPGYYGLPEDTYVNVLNGWTRNSTYNVIQDVVEERLAGEAGGSRSRAFYNWVG